MRNFQAVFYRFAILIFNLALAGSSDALAQEYCAHFTNSNFYSFASHFDTIAQLTIECWLRPTIANQTAWPIYLGDQNSGIGVYLQSDLAPGYPSPATLHAGGVTSVTGNTLRLPPNVWTHVAITRSDSTWRLYRNGMYVGKGNPTLQQIDPTFNIGLHFEGDIAGIRVWNSELQSRDIIRVMHDSIDAKSANLIAYFPISPFTDSPGSLRDAVTGRQAISKAGTSAIHINRCDLQFDRVLPPLSRFLELPEYQRFIARSSGGYGPIAIRGSILSPGWDSVIIVKMRDDAMIFRKAYQLSYTHGESDFTFRDSIRAEKSNYGYALYAKSGSNTSYLCESADLVAGDVYLVDGQSNAHFGYNWYFWLMPFVRTLGVQTSSLNFGRYDPADTSWGYANASGWGEYLSGKYFIGIWPWRLAQNILNQTGIPICIMNGAAGASNIEEHLRNESAPIDLSSIYGRLLYRAKAAHVDSSISAIFWHQGEFNGPGDYRYNFNKLRDVWEQDYPGRNRKTYVIQVRPGCGNDSGGLLREVQREFGVEPDIQMLSTAALQGHDGCHFDAYGYDDLGDNIARLVLHDLYGSQDSLNILPPNVEHVMYDNPDSSRIRVVFRPSDRVEVGADTLLAGRTRSLKDFLYVDGAAGHIQSVTAKSNSLLLDLGVHSQFRYLSYTPDRTYPDTNSVYEGPWITNPRKIGALTFANVAIEPYTVSEVSMQQPKPSFFVDRTEIDSRSIKIFLSSLHSGVFTIGLYDVLGKRIFGQEQTVDDREARIEMAIPHLGRGPYFLLVACAQYSQVIPFTK